MLQTNRRILEPSNIQKCFVTVLCNNKIIFMTEHKNIDDVVLHVRNLRSPLTQHEMSTRFFDVTIIYVNPTKPCDVRQTPRQTCGEEIMPLKQTGILKHDTEFHENTATRICGGSPWVKINRRKGNDVTLYKWKIFIMAVGNVLSMQSDVSKSEIIILATKKNCAIFLASACNGTV